MMKTVACGRYVIKQKLGAGSFGEIHRGEDKETGQSVAIKLESVKAHVPQLSYESKLYNIFKNGVNIPKFYWFGTESSHNSMVIELLGKSLEDISAQFPRHRLSLKTVLMLADQMLSAVQYLHLMNFIHRDIKPDNFVMGIGKNSNKVFIIDFGLSKKYRDPHTHQHIKYTERKDLTGTARYASLAALKGIEQSRRDDLEALGFVWLYLLRGDLPWMGLDAHNRRQKYDRICQVKEETSFESLCSGFPDEFVRYFYNVRSLRFVEEPDYSHFRKMFRKLFIRLGYVYDYAYDWTVSTPQKHRSTHEIYNTLNNTSHIKTKEHKPKADFLSDREKRPKMPINIPNQEKNKQQSKSRRGINEIQNNLDPVNINLSTAPQLSQRKGTYAKDTNDQNRIKNNFKKSKRLGKSEADAYPRMQVPAPKNDLSDSTSSDDQLRLSQMVSKRAMKSTNTNTSSNVNTLSRRAMISKTPNRNSQNYGRLDRAEIDFYKFKSPHPLAPTPTSTPNLVSISKHKMNRNSNKNDYSSYSDKNEAQNENQDEKENMINNQQQNVQKEIDNNIKIVNDGNNKNDDEYYSTESYSYEDEIEARIQNHLKKQNTVNNTSSVDIENDYKNEKRNAKQHVDSSLRANNNSNARVSKNPTVDSPTKQKSKSPGRSDGYNGASKRKSQQNKIHYNTGGNNYYYNTADSIDETNGQTKVHRQKRNEVNPEQNQNDTNNSNNINNIPICNERTDKKKKKGNSTSSEDRSNGQNELISQQSAPIPKPSVPTLIDNNNVNNGDESVNEQSVPQTKDIQNDQKQRHSKTEKQSKNTSNNNDINNANNVLNANNTNKTKLKRSLSNAIKQINNLLESSSSQDAPGLINPNTQLQNQNTAKKRNNQKKRSDQNEDNSYNSINNYYSSNSNSSFNFEQNKESFSKTPQRNNSSFHYATTNSAANPNPKQEMRNSRHQVAETPDRLHNSRPSYLNHHHTDVVRDKRLPMTELSGSVTSTSSYDDANATANNNNTNINSKTSKSRGNSGSRHHHSTNMNERRKEKSVNERDHEHRSKDRSSNLRGGGETDVGVIQQRMKIPKPDKDFRDVRRERDRDRNDDEQYISENLNLSGKNAGRRSDALFQSRSPNLRPVPRPGAKKKYLANKDRRNSLRPAAIIPNWMNEKFKGRK
ncbi:hypothetical protein M9Y10_019276 [Tritrichomonas musculus]|uniref:non-specific serine/threonine protein kinase n=1 Tax=Tritrichomonas musculus TaxID=1915356 RepID=A0ABR2HJX4_9EUKA